MNRLQAASHTRRMQQRRGAILIVAMVCLVLLSSLGLSAVKTAVRWHRQMLAEEALQQATLLVEAGRQRAAHQLSANNEYTGESWNISAADLGGTAAASVRIDVKKPNGNTDRHDVTVRAVYPVGATRHATRTRQYSIAISSPKK